MEKIPTAEEFNNDIRYVTYSLDEKLITFAKLHVEAALKAAGEKAKIKREYEGNTGSEYCYEYVDSSSILKSYPLENIQ